MARGQGAPNQPARIDPTTGEIIVFRPEEALVKDAKLDAVIEYAKRIRDWPLLERAVGEKVDEQAEFVRWWRNSVRRLGNPAKKSAKLKNAERGSLTLCDAEKLTDIKQQQVSKWAKRLQKPDEYRAALFGVTYRQAMGALLNNFRAQAEGQQEWYTPAEYIEAAREAMGAIDLDPASSAVAQKTVKAAEYFTLERNGLAQPWHGRVFLNPPYKQPEVGQFVAKLVSEFKSGRVKQAILLVNNCTDTGWFHAAANKAAVVCFTVGRITYVNPDGDSTSPTQGQAFFYFGPEVNAFISRFAAFGLLMVRA